MRSLHRVLMVLAGAAAVVTAGEVAAHCDSVDGPVAADVRAATAAGDPTPILKWVPEEEEATVRDAFRRAAEVRRLGGAAEELADRWLLETVVRVHRAGEGAPYTGIEPAGRIDPGIQLADRALAAGSPEMLVEAVGRHVTREVAERFARAAAARAVAEDSVASGREYVAAYVALMHTIEGLHAALASEPAVHGHQAAAPAAACSR